MTISTTAGSIVASQGQTIDLSTMFAVSAANNPQYLLVTGLDRNEYTAASTGSLGAFVGNGATDTLTALSGDADTAGILFTYDAATGQYVNATFGSFSSLAFTASSDLDRNTDISVFASNSASLLTTYANDPVSLSQAAPSTLIGTVDLVTQQGATGAPTTQATPNSVVNAAMSFVGQTWNDAGCWVLASNISADAGASLSLTSTQIGVAGQANGEWIVAYNGPAGQSSNWRTMLKAGEIVQFQTSYISGHIATVVSGSGATAELVDNASFANADGSIANAANDGSDSDIVIAGPHLASDELAYAMSGTIIIYELDTPVVTVTSSKVSVLGGAKLALGSLVSAADPAGKAVTQYQVYDTGTGLVSVGGTAVAAHSSDGAVTLSASQLSSLALIAGTTSQTDTIEIRAYNGSYWGDWQGLNVTVNGKPAVTAPPAPAPIVTTVSNVESSLATLASNAGSITTITATGGTVSVGVADFSAYELVLNKVVGGFAVTGKAAEIAAALPALADDITNIASITAIDGPIAISVGSVLAYGSTLQKITGGYVVSDSVANVQAGLGLLVANTNQITSISVGGAGVGGTQGPVTVSAAAFLADRTTLDKIDAGFSVVDTAANLSDPTVMTALAADPHITTIAATDGTVSVGVAKFNSYRAMLDKIVGGYSVVANIAGNLSSSLDAIASDYNAGDIKSVSIAAGGGTLVASAAQAMGADKALLDAIGSFSVSDTAATLSSANVMAALTADSHIGSVVVSDGQPVSVGVMKLFTYRAALDKITTGYSVTANLAVNVSQNIDAIAAEYNAGHLTSIAIAPGAGTVTVTAAQATGTDQATLDAIGSYAVSDTAAALGNTNTLAALAQDASHISSIAASDGQQVSVGVMKFVGGRAALDKVNGGYSITANLAVNVSQNIDAIADEYNAGHLKSVVMAPGAGTVEVTSAQASRDHAVLQSIGSYATSDQATDGSITTTAQGANVTLAAQASGNETFVFTSSVGQSTIANFASHLDGMSHDTVALPSAEFANLAAALNSAYDGVGGAVITGQNGDTLTLSNMTAAAVINHANDFKLI